MHLRDPIMPAGVFSVPPSSAQPVLTSEYTRTFRRGLLAAAITVFCSTAVLVLLLCTSLPGGAQHAAVAAPNPPTGCPGVWSVVPSPNTTSTLNYLTGLAVVSPSDIWAVGYTAPNLFGGSRSTLTEHWDGTSWSIVPSPNPGINNVSLSAAVALASNNVWAVGYYCPDGSHGQT